MDTDAPILLEPDHTYIWRGEELVSVTQVIEQVGLIDLTRVPSETLWYTAEWGRMIHRACELHDRGTLDYDALDPDLRPYVDAYLAFLETGIFKVDPDWIERRLAHPRFRYAGTPDRVGWSASGHRAVLDLKSGVTTGLHPANGLQLAAYGELIHENDGGKVLVRFGLQLCPGKRPPYRLEAYRDPDDLRVFLNALSVVQWRRRKVEGR
jgi:hypothetical protein